MFVVWALTGFWHGANWSFILWGLFFFVFLIVEKYLVKPKKNPTIWWRIPRILLTQIIIYVSFMIFKFTDLASFGQAFIGIFTSNGNGFSDVQTAMTFKNNVFFILISVLACTPVIPTISALLDKTKLTSRLKACVGVVIPVILLVLSSFALAGDSYNPFLYFQF
jgi:alginate O-acetyltransferase complex protein AlgI